MGGTWAIRPCTTGTALHRHSLLFTGRPAVLGRRAALRCRLPLWWPLSRAVSRAHHSTPPSGTHIAHSAPPSGTRVSICAVARKYRTTRRHRVARASHTQRHRAARQSRTDPLPRRRHDKTPEREVACEPPERRCDGHAHGGVAATGACGSQEEA